MERVKLIESSEQLDLPLRPVKVARVKLMDAPLPDGVEADNKDVLFNPHLDPELMGEKGKPITRKTIAALGDPSIPSMTDGTLPADFVFAPTERAPGPAMKSTDEEHAPLIVDYAAYFKKELTRWFNLGSDGDPVHEGVYQTSANGVVAAYPESWRKYFGGHQWSKACKSAQEAALETHAVKLYSGPMYWRGLKKQL